MSSAIILRIEPQNDIFISGENSNQQQFIAYATADDGTQHDVTGAVNWTSSDISTLTIDSEGLGTINKAGQVTVTASFNGISSSTTFVVKNLSSIIITNTNLSIGENETSYFGASLQLSDGQIIDGTNKVAWSVSDQSLGTIDQTGKFTANKYNSSQNQVVVYANYIGQETSILVTLRPASTSTISSIKITPSSLTLDANVSLSANITAVDVMSNGFSEDITSKSTWTVTNPAVATINQRGMVVGLSNGSTTIQIQKGGISAYIPLTVKNISNQMTSFEIIPKNFILPWEDGYGSIQFRALAIMSDYSVVDVTNDTTWSSSNPVVAPITTEGVAKGTAKGVASIQASYGGFSDQTNLTTGATLTGISISPNVANIEINTDFKFDVIAHFSDFPDQIVSNYATWTSSDSTYLTQEIGGLFHGTEIGVTNIRAYFYGETDEIKTNILQSPIYIQTLTINPSNSLLFLQFRNTVKFSVIANYNDGTSKDITSIAVMSVSDPTAGTINSSGLFTSNNITANETIQILASYNDVNGQTNLSIVPIPLPDTTPPGSITYIRQENTDTTITFNFRLPSDADFYKVNVYRDGKLIGNTQTGRFMDTGLTPKTNYSYQFTTVDSSNNESTPISYHATTHPYYGLQYREPLMWTGNIIVNQNNQVYSTDSNNFIIGNANDEQFNPYLITWKDVKCASCESIYQSIRNNIPLGDFKNNGWEYVYIAEANAFSSLNLNQINILHDMKSDELQWGMWCRECGSVIFSKVYLKEFDSRVELGMTFFPGDNIVPKYTFKLPASTKIQPLNNNSIGSLLIYKPTSSSFEQVSLTMVMPTTHLAQDANGNLIATITLNPNMNEVSVQLAQLPTTSSWDEETSYALSITKSFVTGLNTIDESSSLQAAEWVNDSNGQPTVLNRTLVGYNILFNYAPDDGVSDFDPKWPNYVQIVEQQPTVVLSGIQNLYSWGDNTFGQLGNGNSLETHIPALSSATDVIYADAGKEHALAVQKNGLVIAWGRNSNGQLGQGTKDDYYHLNPQVVKSIDHLSQVAAGWFHSLVLTTNGTVWAWGGNYKGQLGNNSTNEKLTPIEVLGAAGGDRYIQNIIKIGAGADYSVALDSSGNVWQWGRDQLVPAQVPGLTNIIDIATGAWHTLALKQDGTVWAWGYNWSGQLGIGIWEYPTGYATLDGYYGANQVQNLENIVALAAGDDHSLALTQSGTVYAWGDNSSGQIGTTSNQNKYWPVALTGMGTITSIGAGEYSSFAIAADGTIYSWGDNSNGVLGIGTTIEASTPQVIGALQGKGITKIMAGESYALAVKGL